ncbi:MAG: hypothetical protein WCI20_08080 [bacterium]
MNIYLTGFPIGATHYAIKTLVSDILQNIATITDFKHCGWFCLLNVDCDKVDAAILALNHCCFHDSNGMRLRAKKAELKEKPPSEPRRSMQQPLASKMHNWRVKVSKH